MMLVLALAIPLVAAYSDDWGSFKQQFGKSYSPDEEDSRAAIFEKNLQFIHHSNANDANNYTLGVNQFSDLSAEEFKAQHTGLLKPAQLYGDIPFLGNHTWNGEELPVSIDWTQKGAVTPVKDQGQCGSCWAFSAVGALEGAMQLATGNLTSLSEQQFVDCATGIVPPLLGCKGGTMSGAFFFAKRHAICTEASYPYQAKGGTCRSKQCMVGIAKGKVLGFKGLSPLARILPGSEKELMSAVAQQPVSVGIEAASTPFQHYKSGVFSGDCGSMPLGLIDHGVLLVGYGTDPVGGDYWKIKNSWKDTWGDKGYIRIKRGDGSRYGQCHVLSSASYPIVSK